MSLWGDWPNCSDPGELFLMLWEEAAPWDACRRLDAVMLPQAELLRLSKLLSEDDGKVALSGFMEAIVSLLPPSTHAEFEELADGLHLSAMMALDITFARVHPRSGLLPPSTASRTRLPLWLSTARDERVMKGQYARRGDRRLVPRGPFARGARGPSDISADSLTDRFNYLTACPMEAAQHEQTLSVQMVVVTQHPFLGVAHTPRRGREAVAFIPLAERSGDLTTEMIESSDHTFLDVQPTVGLDLAARLKSALDQIGEVDIAVAPELTMPEAQAAAFGILAGKAPVGALLTFAGSGHSDARDKKGRAWNQATVLNRLGRKLWSHKKVWPYGMSKDRAEQCNLANLQDGEMLMEHTACGGEVTVADVEGLGRIILVICQDVQMSPVIPELLRLYQPDWFIVPVMDPGIHEGRWIHSRTYELSCASRSKFLVVSSLAMAEWAGVAGFDRLPIGLAVGPRLVSDEEVALATQERAVALLVGQGHNPEWAKIQWGTPDSRWKTTNIGSA